MNAPAVVVVGLERTEQERSKARAHLRRWRSARPRIDYYPDPHAVATIDSLRLRQTGGDASSIINRIIREYAPPAAPSGSYQAWGEAWSRR